MLPWLLYKWRWGDSTRTLIAPAIRKWLELACHGLQFLPEGSACWIDVSLFTSRQVDRLTVDKHMAVVPNWFTVVGVSPEITQSFLNFCSNPEYAGLRPESNAQAESIVNILLYLLHTADPGFWYLTRKPGDRLQAVVFLFRILGVGMELYMYHVYIPSNPSEPAQTLRTEKGRRHLAYDEVLRSLEVARDVGGSSNTVMRARTGRRDLDQTISRITCVLHRERMKEAFAGKRTLTLQWDPGTYSNKSWNVGLAATTCCNIGAETSGDLAPKVAGEGLNLYWERFGR